MGKFDNNVLLIIDASYCAYFCAYSAVKRWKDQYYNSSLETIQLPEPGSVPYEDLPDLINDTFYFKKVLLEVATEKLEVINNIVFEMTGHFYSNATGTAGVDTIVARDSHSQENFRRHLFPEYKIQRSTDRANRNEFNHWKILDYIYSNIFPQVLPTTSHTIMLPGAEGDDIVAVAASCNELKDKYKQVILISSDHDFCQLHRPENRLRQFNLKAEEVLCTFQFERQGQKITVPINADQALLIKIITGDKSDNIPGIKKRLGPVGAYKLVNENAKENLKKLFDSDKDAAIAFQLNRKIISFDEIPQDLKNSIIQKILEELS